MNPSKKQKGSQVSDENLAFVRVSISFPSDIYQTQEEIAGQKKASVVLVVRDAAKRYISQKSAK